MAIFSLEDEASFLLAFFALKRGRGLLAREIVFLEKEFPPCQSLAIDFATRASKREDPEGKISFALLLQWLAASLCSQAKLESERKLLVKNSEGMGILEQL